MCVRDACTKLVALTDALMIGSLSVARVDALRIGSLSVVLIDAYSNAHAHSAGPGHGA